MQIAQHTDFTITAAALWLALLITGAATALPAEAYPVAPAASDRQDGAPSRAAIGGTITDVSGAIVAGAAVTLRAAGGAETKVTKSDAAGRYRITDVEAGSYDVSITMPGFSPFERAGIAIAGQSSITIDAMLSVAGLQEAVSVAGVTLNRPADISRLPVPLDRLPQAVALVSRDVIVEQHAVALTDALRNVSGVSSRGTDAGTNDDFNIRGFQTNPRGNYFRDGVRFFNGYMTETGSLDRVEVLKGPASILFGSVEPGGVINLVTRPLSRVARREFSFDIGSDGDKRAQVDVAGPLSARWQYRVYASVRDAASFRDVVDGTRYFTDSSLGWTPSASTSVTFNVTYLNDRQTPDTGIPAIQSEPANVAPSSYYGEPYNFDKQSGGTGTLKLVHTWSNQMRLSSTVSYYDIRRDRYEATPQNPNVGLPGQDAFPGLARRINRSLFINDYTHKELATQHDLVLKTRTGALSHTVLLGIDARRFKALEDADDGLPFRAAYFIDLDAPVHAAGKPSVPGFPVFFRFTDQREIATGGYAQDSIDIGPRWTVLAGVRYDHNTLKQDQRTSTAASFTRTSGAATPRVGLVFKPVTALSLYTSYSRSFSPKIGTIFPNTPVEPEKAEQTEGGIKAAAGEHLSATIAVYELTRKDVVVGDPARTSYSLQVGEQRSRGTDIDVTLRPTRSVSLVAGYAFIDALIVRDTRLPVGNLLDNAPRHSGSLWGSYRFDGRARGLTAGAGLFVVGERQGNLENNFRLPGYTRADAMVAMPFGPASISLNVTNLTNGRYYLNSWRRDRIMPGAPREFALTVRYAF